jgi:hypothetical protein
MGKPGADSTKHLRNCWVVKGGRVKKRGRRDLPRGERRKGKRGRKGNRGILRLSSDYNSESGWGSMIPE